MPAGALVHPTTSVTSLDDALTRAALADFTRTKYVPSATADAEYEVEGLPVERTATSDSPRRRIRPRPCRPTPRRLSAEQSTSSKGTIRLTTTSGRSGRPAPREPPRPAPHWTVRSCPTRSSPAREGRTGNSATPVATNDVVGLPVAMRAVMNQARRGTRLDEVGRRSAAGGGLRPRHRHARPAGAGREGVRRARDSRFTRRGRPHDDSHLVGRRADPLRVHRPHTQEVRAGGDAVGGEGGQGRAGRDRGEITQARCRSRFDDVTRRRKTARRSGPRHGDAGPRGSSRQGGRRADRRAAITNKDIQVVIRVPLDEVHRVGGERDKPPVGRDGRMPGISVALCQLELSKYAAGTHARAHLLHSRRAVNST